MGGSFPLSSGRSFHSLVSMAFSENFCYDFLCIFYL